jgi:hypothetical protein
MTQMTTFEMFKRNRGALQKEIESCQAVLNGIIEREGLRLPVFNSLPD